jgi:hypothetical protein
MAIGNQRKLSIDTVLPLGKPRPGNRPADAYDAPEAGTVLVADSSDVWSLGVTLVDTDPFSPVPDLEGPFKVRCDDCGKTYVYKPSDVRRYEGEVPKFTTRPLF